jgi:hypothetical protein
MYGVPVTELISVVSRVAQSTGADSVACIQLWSLHEQCHVHQLRRWGVVYLLYLLACALQYRFLSQIASSHQAVWSLQVPVTGRPHDPRRGGVGRLKIPDLQGDAMFECFWYMGLRERFKRLYKGTGGPDQPACASMHAASDELSEPGCWVDGIDAMA